MAPLTTEKRVRLGENDQAQRFGDDIPPDELEKLRTKYGDDPIEVRQKWIEIFGDENAEGRRAQRIKESGIIYRDQYWDASDRVWRLEKPKTPPKIYSDDEHPVLLVKRLHSDKRAYLRTEVDVEAVNLRNILRNIFAGSKLTLGDHENSLEPRYFYWARAHLEAFRDHCEDIKKKDVKEEIILALEFCHEHFKSVLGSIDEMLNQSWITWEHLWAILPPNVLVLGHDQLGQPRVYRIRSHEPKKKEDGSVVLLLEAEFADYDGISIGLANTELEIQQYTGFKKIVDLKFCPLHMHPDRNEIWEHLIKRNKGQLEIQVEGYSVQEHKGHGLILTRDGITKFNFRGRVMIDPAKMDEVEPNNLIPILDTFPVGVKSISNKESPTGLEVSTAALLDPPQESQGQQLRSARSSFYERFRRVLGYRSSSKKPNDKEVDHEKQKLERRKVFNRLTDFQLILFSGLVYGYCFADTKWGAFSIQNIREVVWNDKIFKSLVMDETFKDLLKRLIGNQKQSPSEFDDFVVGKGQGLVGLFFGDPGIGKTYTAEAIAEIAELPLYMVSTGALGSGVKEINSRLSRILDLASHWSAVLLIDEADVFLAKRDIKDLERNAIVSVFLKEVEYYPGILLMTTNRETDIDVAFRSRIHFCHHYPSLGEAVRKEIWNNFFNKHPNLFKVDEAELDELAKLEFNGRQIKNALSMSTKLAADEEGRVVTAELILKVARTLQDFSEIEQIGKDATKGAQIHAVDANEPGNKANWSRVGAQIKGQTPSNNRASDLRHQTTTTRASKGLLEPQSTSGGPTRSRPVTPQAQRASNRPAKG